jgi:hypothetical protein
MHIRQNADNSTTTVVASSATDDDRNLILNATQQRFLTILAAKYRYACNHFAC